MIAVETAAQAPVDDAAPAPGVTTAVTLTFFRAGEKANGFRSTTPWEKLYTHIAKVGPAKTKAKLDLPGWCAATFKNNHRALSGIEHVYAVVLDFDNMHKPKGANKAEPLPVDRRTTPDAAMALWGGTRAFFYTSWSHTAGLPKFRLVLPLSRPVTTTEFNILWQHVAAVHEHAGHIVDPQCKDASHLWFFGARRNEHYATGMQEGELLDVDNILVATSIANDVTIDDEPTGVSSTGSTQPTNLKERASRYLARMPEAISGSGGHAATFKAALVLVRGFGLGTEDSFDMLMREYNPRCEPIWTEKELRHKVEGAAKLHDPPIGYLLKTRRGSASAAFAAALSEPTIDAENVEDSHDLPFTDDGNALRLVGAFKDVIRYVIESKSFIRWNGKVWERDPEGHLVREDMRALARRWADAAFKIPNEEARKRAIAWALKSQSSARLEAAVELAKGDHRIRIHTSDIDAHPYLLNVQNGILDLRDIDNVTSTCKLHPHDPKYLLTRITRFGYLPEAICPTWTTFCTFSASGKAEVEAYRRRRRGSYLSASPDKVFEIAFGTGDTGKTTYYQTIANVMGDYAEKVDKRVFEKQKNEQHPTHLMELEDLRFAYGAEIEGYLDIQQVKDLTGERKIKGRRMHENMRSFTRRYKLAVFANDKPKVRRTNTDPIWNRIHADEWKAVITAKKAEAEIDETYEREGEGILADMVRGWVDFWQHGLAPPQAILDVTKEYRDDEDPVQAWLDDRCDVSDPSAETPFSVLSESRKAWLEANDPERKETAKALAKLLEQRGFPKGKDGTSAAIRKGIKLCTPKVCAEPSGISTDEPEADLTELLERAAHDGHDDRTRSDLLELV